MGVVTNQASLHLRSKITIRQVETSILYVSTQANAKETWHGSGIVFEQDKHNTRPVGKLQSRGET
jgi:hypothetical protein